MSETNVMVFPKGRVTQSDGKIHFSELFYSLEGEGIFVGCPTVFLRLFGCNLSCPGFGLPAGQTAVHTTPINSLNDVDAAGVTTRGGCDSAYSWHPTYKNLRKTKTINEMCSDIIGLVPPSIRNPQSTRPVPVWVLSFTGGEPMLHQKQIAGLIDALMDHLDEYQEFPAPILLFETNGTVELSSDLKSMLKEYLECYGPATVSFCVSPKLSNSGESRAVAINPKAFNSLYMDKDDEVIVYLKYVSNGSDESVAEIQEVTELLMQYGENSRMSSGAVDNDSKLSQTRVFLMPEGSTSAQLAATSRKVAEACLRHGFMYSPRLHVDLFGNAVGT